MTLADLGLPADTPTPDTMRDWPTRAACRDAPLELFISCSDDPDDDPPYPAREALAYCDVCEVRTECLAWALAHDEQGVWGGTTSYQRRQLDRPRDRTSCPGCASRYLVVEGDVELCLGCGLSWYVI